MALGTTQPLTGMSTRNIPRGKRRYVIPCVGNLMEEKSCLNILVYEYQKYVEDGFLYFSGDVTIHVTN
jgi:hypothetical protein